MKTATQVGILVFALKSLGVALTKEAISSNLRAGGAGIAKGLLGLTAVIGVATFALASAFNTLIDSFFDFAAREKQLEETIKSGDIANAREELKDFNRDREAANRTKVAGDTAIGAGVGASVGAIAGTKLGAALAIPTGGLSIPVLAGLGS